MNKHNVTEIVNYKQDKFKSNIEQSCFKMLDTFLDKIADAQVYSERLKEYIGRMLDDGNINQPFKNNIVNQIDLMFMESWASINKKED